MRRLALLALLLVPLVVAGCASLGDETKNWTVEKLYTEAKEKLDGSVKFFFGNQETPKILTKLGTDVTNQKTNAVGKSDEKACNWVFLSALIQLEKRAKQLGANAVVNIVSYYKKDVMSSATEFECHAGAVIAGVALKGDFVKVAE